jgi:hypothetical protein
MHLDYSFFLSPGEHTVPRLKRCETSGCQGYGFLLIRLIPSPHVESSGENGHVFYSRMGVWCNLVIAGSLGGTRRAQLFRQQSQRSVRPMALTACVNPLISAELSKICRPPAPAQWTKPSSPQLYDYCCYSCDVSLSPPYNLSK